MQRNHGTPSLSLIWVIVAIKCPPSHCNPPFQHGVTDTSDPRLRIPGRISACERRHLEVIPGMAIGGESLPTSRH
ncbi:hypothetical protein KC19_6G194600 [Ceratodon purpureus]|uniref:Secreted protein n=1 Tax=Ceratodon purpureus TaxID=3225 RepID=A0A8T0HJB6_CERPU|nr:hypothetical protein KC19_6G194600 [Ceratodon purpureus]